MEKPWIIHVHWARFPIEIFSLRCSQSTELTSQCRLSFIATLIYASVVFHRDRKSTTAFRFQPHDRLASSATEPISEINRPQSPSNSELPVYSERPLIQSSMSEQEGHELGAREEREVGLRPTSGYREMGGDDAIYELAAQRSVKSGKGSSRDGGAKGSWESRRE